MVAPAIAPTEPDDDDSTVIILSEEEFEEVLANLLRAAGCTYEELREQARTGAFRSAAAHRAWAVIRGFVEE